MNTYYRDEPVAPFLDRSPACPFDPAGPPADLVEVFTQPVPALMICEPLGVPYEDRDRFLSSPRALPDAGSAEAQVYGVHSLPVTRDRG